MRRFDTPPLIVALLLPAVVTVLGTWWTVYEFHLDEGINLIKGALVAEGYRLYDPIWSDQPPVLTIILAGIHKLFPFSVGAARAVIIAFSSLLLWSLFRMVRRSDGTLAAWTAVALLGLSPLYLLFSVSVLIGLPSIALAVCGLDQAMVGASRQSRWRLVAAGVLFGLSLQIKMFTAIMIPSLVVAVIFLASDPPSINPSRNRHIAWLLGALLATFVGITLMFHEPILDQLIAPHWKESMSTGGRDIGAHGWIGFAQLLAVEPVLLAFAVAGVIATLLRPRQLYGPPLIPTLWLVISVLVYTHHKPVWPHHLPMTLVPMAWLGGRAVALAADWLGRAGVQVELRRALAMVLFAALIGAGGWSPPRFGVVEVPPNPIVLQMVRLKTDASEPSWVVTDNPMDAYRAHVLVPPELAVITAKRLRQGFLTTDSFKALIEEAKPSQVMFRNFVFDGEILEYLGRSPSYRRVAWSSETHFVRTDLIAGGANPFPPPPVWPTPR